MSVILFLKRSLSALVAVVVLLMSSLACADYNSSGACWNFDGPADTSKSEFWYFGVKGSPDRHSATKLQDDTGDSGWITGDIPVGVTEGLYSFSTAFTAKQIRPANGDAKIEFFFFLRFDADPWCTPTDIWIDDIQGGFYDPNINGTDIFHSCTFLLESDVDFEGDHKIEFVFDLAVMNAELLEQNKQLPSVLALYIQFDEIVVQERDVNPYPPSSIPEPAGMLILGGACVFLPFRRRLISLLS